MNHSESSVASRVRFCARNIYISIRVFPYRRVNIGWFNATIEIRRRGKRKLRDGNSEGGVWELSMVLPRFSPSRWPRQRYFAYKDEELISVAAIVPGLSTPARPDDPG